MYCRHCGKEIKDNSKFCTHCGKSAVIPDSNSETTDFGEEKKKKKSYQKWSWGAFSWPWLYLYYMKYKIWWVFFIIIIISNVLMKSNETLWLGALIWLIVAIYFGLSGRKIAWENRKWEDINQFRRVQRSWDIFGMIIWIILQVIFFYA